MVGLDAAAVLAGGNYPASDKVKLTAEDAVSAAAPTVWRNIDGQIPRLLGGRRLTASDFQAVTNMETLGRIAPEAKGKIVAPDLKALNVLHSNKPKDVFSDWGGLPDLFVEGKHMPLARFPNDLLHRELLSSWHLSPFLGMHHPEILSLKAVTFKGGRSAPLIGLLCAETK